MTDQEVQVGSLSSYAPHKTLGHWKAPAGKSTTQLRIIMSKMKTISLRISTSHLSRFRARLAYHAIYVGTLPYVLPQCHFSASHLRQAEHSLGCSTRRRTNFTLHQALAHRHRHINYASNQFIVVSVASWNLHVRPSKYQSCELQTSRSSMATITVCSVEPIRSDYNHC